MFYSEIRKFDLKWSGKSGKYQGISFHELVGNYAVVNKVFGKHVNNRIVDHVEKCGLFFDFQYGFRSSRSTADLLTVVSDRISDQAVAHDISKAFDRVCI